MSAARRALATTGRTVAVATLLAGAVGVLRQRHEQEQVRRGRLAPATAARELPPRHEPGPLGRRLAAWVPDRPHHRLGRIAAAIWAAPLTVVGLAMAGVGGGTVRWDRQRGCLVVTAVGGPSALALRAVGADANAVGHVILSPRSRPPEALLDHEAVHVRQAERLGPLLFPTYVWLGARYGYRDHPLERAARAGARAATSTSGTLSPTRP